MRTKKANEESLKIVFFMPLYVMTSMLINASLHDQIHKRILLGFYVKNHNRFLFTIMKHLSSQDG